MRRKFHISIILFLICEICCSLSYAQKVSDEQENFSHLNSNIPVVAGSKGDVDGNGIIEIFDLIRARDISLGRLTNPDDTQIFAGDINSNGSVGRDDVERIRDILLLKAVPPPTIFSINPSSGRVGDQIVIEGAGFNSTPSNNLVTFGEIMATVISATTTKLTVIVPAGASSGNVTITVAGQNSNAVYFTLLVYGTPVISSISPDMGVVRQEVVINGQGFGQVQGNSTLSFGSVQAESEDIKSWSDNVIVSRIPEGSSTGEVTVTVDGEVSNGVLFTVAVIEIVQFQAEDIAEDPETGALYVKNTIILDFRDYVSDEDISSFLSTNALTQIGQISQTKMIQARIDDGRSPWELAVSLESSPLLENAVPDLIVDLCDVVSESFTPSLLRYYNQKTATFTGNKGQNNYHHFAMRTFAAHRLVDAILENRESAPNVRVAIIDAGLGNGTNANPSQFGNRIRAPTQAFMTLSPFSRAGIKSDITAIPDEENHGTGVAGMAGADGETCLGVGKHAHIRPIDVSFPGSVLPMSTIVSGFAFANLDPKVKVINLSFSSGKPGRTDAQNLKIRDNDNKLYKPYIEKAVHEGKIITIAAGNQSQLGLIFDTNMSSPQCFAPDQPRKSTDPTILNVAATDRFGEEVKETRWEDSNIGEKISVAAPGAFTNTVLKSDFTAGSYNGTSYAAPLVAGLAAELFITNPSLSGQQVVRIIEKTADDIWPMGIDTNFGNGRINVWKAVLSAVNGGLATEISNPGWYGFEIRASQNTSDTDIVTVLKASFMHAEVYIGYKKLDDFSNDRIPQKEITLFKNVQRPGSPGSEIIPIPEGVRLTDFLSTFSVTSDELSEVDGKPIRLALRQPGQTANDVPFYELPINLTKMKSGSVPGVGFDDFVFTIQVPRILKTESKSLKDGNMKSVIKVIANVKRIAPIGVPGDSVVFTISYPGYIPSKTNTDIEFFPPQNAALVEPEVVTDPPPGFAEANKVIKTIVHDRADTGPIKILYTDQESNLITTFATVDPFIIPKVVKVEKEGNDVGDKVKIFISVPRYTATKEKTEIKFPGKAEYVQPINVLPGDSPGVTNILESEIPAGMGSGPVTIRIEVDNGQKVEFSGGELEKLHITSIFPGCTFVSDKITVTGTGFKPESQVLFTESGKTPVLGTVVSQLEKELVVEVPSPSTPPTEYDQVVFGVKVKNSDNEVSNEIDITLYQLITKGSTVTSEVKFTGDFDNPFRTPEFIFSAQKGDGASVRVEPILTQDDILHPMVSISQVIPHEPNPQFGACNGQKIAEHMTPCDQVENAEILGAPLPETTNYLIYVDGVCLAPGPAIPVTWGPFRLTFW